MPTELAVFNEELCFMPDEIEIKEVMSQHIILTTGLYDLIKDHVRRKKVTP
jgi:regulator of nucleoside diphosphate kinase